MKKVKKVLDFFIFLIYNTNINREQVSRLQD